MLNQYWLSSTCAYKLKTCTYMYSVKKAMIKDMHTIVFKCLLAGYFTFG